MSKNSITLEDIGFSKEDLIREVDGHVVCIKNHVRKLSFDTKIYRYMRMSTLTDMLFYNMMHVSNRESFTDLREKKGLNVIVEEISSQPNYIPSYRDKLRIKRMEKDKQRFLSICVSCWTCDKRSDGYTNENYLIWKAYANNDIVCRIGTTIGQLVNCIKKTSCDIAISDVDYSGKTEMNPYEELVFRKSIFYEDEQEVRMAVLSNNKAGVDLEIDNNILLNEVKISPFIPPVLGTFILRELKEWCKRYPNVRIEYSKVMEYVETNKSNK